MTSLKKPNKTSSDSDKNDSVAGTSGSCFLEPGPSTSFSSSSCFLEAGPSKSFTSSTLRFSTSKTGTPQSGKKKRSFRKLSVEAELDLPLNDDCNELIEEKERSLAEKEKSLNKSSNKTEDEPDLSVLKTMSIEQMQEHMSRCLQLSTENKINTKNAFALKLIDCMTIITKSDNKSSNFAAMACQLDAGAKIYSSRVDAVYQQVMKLVDTCIFAEKKKKEGEGEGDENGSDIEGENGEKKEKKKKPRKKVITTNDQISRHPKEKDPRDQFVKLEALPGDILNKAKYCSEDLSLTLDKHRPFWVDWQNYKPTRIEGETEILDIEIKTRKIQPKIDLDHELDLTSICKLEPLLSSTTSTNDAHEGSDMDIDFERLSLNDPSQSTEDSKETEDSHEFEEDSPIDEMVSLVKTRMAGEGSNIPTTNDVMKTLFHEPDESDYHYLKMDNSNFWAGPSHWKRPHGHDHAENKKKVMRKKREPIEVQYTEPGVGGPIEPEQSRGIGMSSKRASTLSKRAMAKWSSKKVTFPQDIHFEPEAFTMLFNVNIVAEFALLGSNEEEEKEKAGEHTIEEDNNWGSQDMFAQSEELNEGGFRGFPSPESSNEEILANFRGFASPSGSSPFDPEHGFRGWGSPVSSEHGDLTCYSPNATMSDSARDPGSCDVYEGENLVPMVKRVKVEPIVIVPKPNRVDMQHLKSVMLNIIRRAIEDRENQLRDEGLSSPRGSVAFREVLSQLFSSDKLHYRTREDLTVQMAFLCLLTLANENAFHFRREDSDDFLIMYYPGP